SQRWRSTLKACTAGRRGYNSRASASEPLDVERRAPRKRRCRPGKQQKEVSMRHYTTPIAITAALLVGYVAANRTVPAQAQSSGPAHFAAVANDLGSLESTGPYEVVPNWPKDLSTLPGKEKWTFGAGQGVFAESPDRVYYIKRGSLPVIAPQGRGAPPIEAPNVAPNLAFPVAGVWGEGTDASPP